MIKLINPPKNSHDVPQKSLNIALLLLSPPNKKRTRTIDFFEETLIELKSYNLYKEIPFKPKVQDPIPTKKPKHDPSPSPPQKNHNDIPAPLPSEPPIPTPTKQRPRETPTPTKQRPRETPTPTYYSIPAHLFDHLFWLFYVCKFGHAKFELEVLSMNKFLAVDAEQIYFQFRIETALMLRKDKQLLHYPSSYRVNQIETPLSAVTASHHQKHTSINLFVALCLIHHVSATIIFEEKHIMIETLASLDTENTHVIRATAGPNRRFVYDREMKTSDPLYQAMKEKFYAIEHVEKPIKACSSYKADDLYQLATKLKLNPYLESDNNKIKMKKKQDMYDEVAALFANIFLVIAS